MRPLFVHLVPALVDPAELQGGTAVVIDVLRASTTICHALAARASRVLPVASIEDALARRDHEPTVLLGGERGGRPIDGFDLGNTPTAYTPDTVAGRMVVFTTTNGTRALLHSRHADTCVVACFANLSSVVDRVADGSSPVHLVCAGTDGAVTMEDCLCAGAIGRALLDRGEAVELANDSARLAVSAYDETTRDDATTGVLNGLRSSQGGRNLAAIGLAADVDVCARIDATTVVPSFDPLTGAITSLG